jgi:hypothetical protein
MALTVLPAMCCAPRLREVQGFRILADIVRLRSYCPVSKLHSAPSPAFCMISFGSIEQCNLEMVSMLDPATP